MVFWLLGDRGATHWEIVWLALAIALAVVWPRARELDWLARSGPGRRRSASRSRGAAARCCSPLRSRPAPRSQPPARSASSASSSRALRRLGVPGAVAAAGERARRRRVRRRRRPARQSRRALPVSVPRRRSACLLAMLLRRRRAAR
jgi:hypothetical protein